MQESDHMRRRKSALTNHRYFAGDISSNMMQGSAPRTLQLDCPLHDNDIPPSHPGRCRVVVNHIASYITLGLYRLVGQT